MYLNKTPDVFKPMYKDLIWDIPNDKNEVYISFDDGPIPQATPYALDVLKEHDALATFFCIGDNVIKHPDIFQRVIDEGHQIGNHSLNHLNGWKYNDYSYIKNVLECAKVVPSTLYRPPYGKIKRTQSAALRKRFSIIMWDVISGDFDRKVSKEKCVKNVVDNTVAGSIIVFHDSYKAFEKMAHSLPLVLQQLKNKGFTFGVIPEGIQPVATR